MRVGTIRMFERVSQQIEEDPFERNPFGMERRHRTDIDDRASRRTQRLRDFRQERGYRDLLDSALQTPGSRVLQQAVDERLHSQDARSQQRQVLLRLIGQLRPKIVLDPRRETRDTAQGGFEIMGRHVGELIVIAQRFTVACVKLGAEGAIAASGDAVVRARSDLVEAASPFGAGDAFAGTLLAALAGGISLEPALEQGCAAGARAAADEPS